ncbi:MAG: hypothetical protein WCD79_04145, partial [Chthoniobacteraceae bacterium]
AFPWASLVPRSTHGCCGCDGFAIGDLSSAGFFKAGDFFDRERFQGFCELLPEISDFDLWAGFFRGLFDGVHVATR